MALENKKLRQNNSNLLTNQTIDDKQDANQQVNMFHNLIYSYGKSDT